MAFEDLLKDSSFPLDNKNYFNVIITDLKLNQLYPLQFRWKYEDGSFSTWSAVRAITTPGPTVPDQPDLRSTDVVGKPGFIEVTWNGNNAASQPISNIDRVDIHISGQSFGDGTKPAGSFRVSGTQTFAATPGSYTVQLKAYTINGSSSFFSTARIVSVTEVGEAIQTPTNPNGFTSKRILAGIEVSWAGTYASSTFTGFEAINIYAGNSATATNGTYEQVGVLTGNNVKNTIVVPLGTYVAYGQAVYIHAAAVNKSGTVGTIQANVTNQVLGPGRATDADINDGAVLISKLASDVLTVGNLKAGDINATSFIRAGTAGSARVELSSANISSGPSAGFYIYNSAGTAILSSPLTGGLSITGSLAATSISTSSGKFAVNSSGILTATDVNLTGAITATTGNVGGLIIAADAIQNGSTSGNSTFRLDSTGKARFGSATGNSVIIDPSGNIYTSPNGGTSTGNFQVSNGNVTITGAITATSGSFTGSVITSNITATGGTIGGWNISPSGYIFSGSGDFFYPTSASAEWAFISLRGISAYRGIFGFAGATGETFYSVGDSAFGSSRQLTISETGYLNTLGGIDIPSGGLGVSGLTSTTTIQVTGTGAPASGTIFANSLGLATTANFITQSNGFLRVNTSSSQRYKDNIVNLDEVSYLNPETLLSLPVRAFKYKSEYLDQNDQRSGKMVPGFIAEELEQIYPAAVDYDENGIPERWNTNFIIPGMLSLIQNLNSRLDALEG